MTKTIKNNRDANEREIIEALQAAGCVVWQMDRKDGFDLIVLCPRTGSHIVEVKNPARKWDYTPAEKKKMLEAWSVNCQYETIETVGAALIMVGVA